MSRQLITNVRYSWLIWIMSHAADEELARRLAQEEEDSQLAQTLARELAIQGTAADVVSAGILGGGGIGGDFGTDVDGLVSGASPSSGNSNGGSKSHGMLNRLSRVLGKQPRRNSTNTAAVMTWNPTTPSCMYPVR